MSVDGAIGFDPRGEDGQRELRELGLKSQDMRLRYERLWSLFPISYPKILEKARQYRCLRRTITPGAFLRTSDSVLKVANKKCWYALATRNNDYLNLLTSVLEGRGIFDDVFEPEDQIDIIRAGPAVAPRGADVHA
jgi:hypothetical protein